MSIIFNEFYPLLLIAIIYFPLFLLLLIILNEALAACIFHFILFYFFHMISRFPCLLINSLSRLVFFEKNNLFSPATIWLLLNHYL